VFEVRERVRGRGLRHESDDGDPVRATQVGRDDAGLAFVIEPSAICPSKTAADGPALS
jgi:hypothetical protein